MELIRNYFQLKSTLILIALVTFFQVKQSDSENIRWFLCHTQSVGTNCKKSAFQKKHYNIEN